MVTPKVAVQRLTAVALIFGAPALVLAIASIITGIRFNSAFWKIDLAGVVLLLAYGTNCIAFNSPKDRKGDVPLHKYLLPVITILISCGFYYLWYLLYKFFENYN